MFGKARQTCPRRLEESGPWEHKENLDWWTRGHWSRTRIGDRIRRWWYHHVTAQGQGSMGCTYWPGPRPQPQVCSFCGSIHPDDAIRLVEAGWEIERTDKPYKHYLHPGTLIGGGSPIPVVKFYTHHTVPRQSAYV